MEPARSCVCAGHKVARRRQAPTGRAPAVLAAALHDARCVASAARRRSRHPHLEDAETRNAQLRLRGISDLEVLSPVRHEAVVAGCRRRRRRWRWRWWWRRRRQQHGCRRLRHLRRRSRASCALRFQPLPPRLQALAYPVHRNCAEGADQRSDARDAHRRSGDVLRLQAHFQPVSISPLRLRYRPCGRANVLPVVMALVRLARLWRRRRVPWRWLH